MTMVPKGIASSKNHQAQVRPLNTWDYARLLPGMRSGRHVSAPALHIWLQAYGIPYGAIKGIKEILDYWKITLGKGIL